MKEYKSRITKNGKYFSNEGENPTIAHINLLMKYPEFEEIQDKIIIFKRHFVNGELFCKKVKYEHNINGKGVYDANKNF